MLASEPSPHEATEDEVGQAVPVLPRQASVAEVDHTCLRLVQVNELLFVYLGLIYASLMRPVSSLSVFYFLCLLIATPLYFYSRWFTVRTRKLACSGLCALSICAFLIQTIMLIYWLCTHSKHAEGLINAVLGERHVTFFLFSFVTRDLVVAATTGLATAALRSKEQQRMTHRETPVRLLAEDSLLAKYWRLGSMALMVLAGVIFPSLLSLPYYLSYLLTASAWALEYFDHEAGQAFYHKWEAWLARLGVVYTLGYLVLIYVFQIPGAAWSTDMAALQRLGVINLSELEEDLPHILPVFILHTASLFLLYSLSSSVLTANVLSSPAPPAVTAPEPVGHDASLTILTDPALTWRGYDQSRYSTSPRQSYQAQAEQLERKKQAQLGAARKPPASPSLWRTNAEKFTAYYGMYLCFIVYVILALQRPTVLGFVFMVIVMVGAALPDFIFRLCAPTLLMYTGCYSAVVYWFGAVIAREKVGGPAEVEELYNVGLSTINAFGGGWARAFIPLFMTTILGLAWRFRSQDPNKRPEDLFTMLFGNPEWKKYLGRYLASYDCTLYICLILSLAVGFDHMDALHLPFVLLACGLLAFPALARPAWPLLVLYTQAFILIEYWLRFKSYEHHHASPRPFYAALTLPVSLFILSCRQLAAFYAKQWTFGYRSDSRRGSMADGQPPRESQPESEAGTLDAQLIAIQKSAARSVNLLLYMTKQASRLVIVCLLWHMAFHTPLNIFAVGYLLLLSCFPVLFVFSRCYVTISRQALPLLFRLISTYSGVVICLLYIFLADDLSGISIERHVGQDLREYGRSFVILNWVLQMLCAMQTEVLRNQVIDLHSQAQAYPRLIHSVKQVLPFVLLVVIFAVVWRYVSLMGSVLLYLGILNAVLGRRVEALWRATLLLSIGVSLLIVLFDLAAFRSYASPTLFWLGLRRGTYIPNPDVPGPSPEEDVSGWQLSPSAERYMVTAFIAALQFFYNTGKDKATPPTAEGDEEEDEASGGSRRRLDAGGERGAVGGVSSAHASPECARRGSFIDNTHAVAPVVSSVLQVLYHGTWADKESAETDPDSGAAQEKARRRSTSSLKERQQRLRLDTVSECLWSLYAALHGMVVTLLGALSTYSFEACVVYVVLAVVLHADLVSLLYLTVFGVLVTRPRTVLERHWRTLVHASACLVMAEYLVVLRLPPSLEPTTGPVAVIMGARQCSLFAQYADAEAQAYPYSYGQWLGLCISDSALLLVDFGLLLLTIVQSKRFKADKLSVEKPLFAPLSFPPPDPEVVANEPLAMNVWRYIVLRYAAYVNILVIFVLSTLTFNLVSLGYLILVAAIVGNHPQEGLFSKRRGIWSVIGIYAASSLFIRIVYQLPVFPQSHNTGSLQVLLGLRKVYEGAFDQANTPPELAFDAVILVLVVLQRRIFLCHDFHKIIDELWYAEKYEHAANGYHVVNQLEKLREASMVTVRTQIRTMYDHLQTLAMARQQIQDDRTWELFLLKNRNAALAATGNMPLVSPVEFEAKDTETGVVSAELAAVVQTEGSEGQREGDLVLSPSLTGDEDGSMLSQSHQRTPLSHDDSSVLSSFTRLGPDASGGGGGGVGEATDKGAEKDTEKGAEKGAERGGAASPTATAHRQQWSALTTDTMSAPDSGHARRDGGSTVTTPTRRHQPVSQAVYEEVTQGLQGAGEGLNAITHWVSASISQAPALDLKDPLLALDGLRARGRSGTTAYSIGKGRGMSVAYHDFMPPEDIAEEEDGPLGTSGGGGGGGKEDDLASIRSTGSMTPPIPLPGDQAHRLLGSGKRSLHEGSLRDRNMSVVSRLEAVVELAVHTRPSEISARAQQMGLRILQSTLLFLNSRSTSMVYAALIFAHIYQPSMLSLIYPITVFGYALLQNPRSLPRIGGSLLHPMVQNPPRQYWNFLIVYAFSMLLVKFVFQFPYFCVCGNAYSHGSQCPSSLPAYADVCPVDQTPRLDYFINQPVVHDYAIGVYKAFKTLPWNQMSLRYEPVDRFVPNTPPGQTSDELLDSGLLGSLLVSLLGDVMVLFSVLWHAHVLKIRGVWLCRDPDMSIDADDHGGSDGEDDGPRGKDEDDKTYGRASGAGSDVEAGVQEEAAEEEERREGEGASRRRSRGRRGSSDADRMEAVLARHKEKVRKQQSLEERVGVVHLLVRRVLRDYCQVFLPSGLRRAKPGVDLYVYLFFLQCVLFLFVMLAYQQAEHLFQSVKENQLSGSFILVLLLHFVVIVSDRCIYLYRSVKAKTALQLCLLLAVYSLVHSDFTFRMGISQGGPVLAWYLFMCLYFFLSALQIGYGYPPFIETNWLTKRVHHAWGNVFRLYRAIPFLYELRMLLDWTCTPTTLYLGEWIKLEDIFSGLYIGACNIHFQELENRYKGQPQPLCRKWGTGFLFFALLNLLVWLPLFIFSTGSLSNYDNPVTDASMTVQVTGFPTLYSASTADYVSATLGTDSWASLAQSNSALRVLPATSTNDYMRELQFVRMPVSSQEVWQISPPAESELLTMLRDPSGSVDININVKFVTEDGALNEGGSVHRLSDREKAQLAGVMVGNRSTVHLEGLLPSVIRVSATKEVTPLLAKDDARPDCVLAFQRRDNGSAVGWWDLTCSADLLSCGVLPTAVADRVVSDTGNGTNSSSPSSATGATSSAFKPLEQKEECKPSMYTISSQKTIGSFVTFGYGIIGLYFTVVLTIGRFVHMSVMGMKSSIMYDDLPRVEVLYELCTTIYLARMYRNLPLEEELYRELIDIYRRPQMIYERTGPYRHWLVKDDDGASAASYLLIVEEELKKYK